MPLNTKTKQMALNTLFLDINNSTSTANANACANWGLNLFKDIVKDAYENDKISFGC